MNDPIFCACCHLQLQRAYLVDDETFCPQCLNADEAEALVIIEASLMDQNVELLNEDLIVLP